MEAFDREARINLARERARKVATILAGEKITFGEALSFASEVFQVLAVMGEVSPVLPKGLAYLAIRLQGTELDTISMSTYVKGENGLLDKHNMPTSSSGSSEETRE